MQICGLVSVTAAGHQVVVVIRGTAVVTVGVAVNVFHVAHVLNIDVAGNRGANSIVVDDPNQKHGLDSMGIRGQHTVDLIPQRPEDRTLTLTQGCDCG